MIRIAILGSGNLAVNLIRSIRACPETTLTALLSRNEPKTQEIPAGIAHQRLSGPMPEADIFILAVSDQAIGALASQYDFGEALVVHASGAQPISVLSGLPRHGIFYPLQTFTKSHPKGLDGVPILLESNNKDDFEILKSLALHLGGHPCAADSYQRLQAHLAAVLANNFTNHLWYLAAQQLEAAGLAGSLLQPLMEETLAKAKALGSFEAQTGPARRGDTPSLVAHRKLLDTGLLEKIYDNMSQSIANTYGTKL